MFTDGIKKLTKIKLDPFKKENHLEHILRFEEESLYIKLKFNFIENPILGIIDSLERVKKINKKIK